MNKKVILFVMHELSVGGAERVVLNLANNLDRNKFCVHICLFKKKGDLVNALAEDVALHDLNASRVITSGHKLFSLILQLKPDIVFSSITHVNLLLGVFIPFLRPFCRNTKFITREVNIPSIRAKHMSKSKKMDYFYKKFIHNFDYIIAQSKYMKEDIQKNYGVDENMIIVVNNPLDIQTVHNALTQENVEKKLFPENRINILAVGNLRRQKGFDILIQVMPMLEERFHLTIIGEGKERALLEKMIKELDISEKVTLAGLQKNPYIYMKKADMIVLSSHYEGFPNVIIEANACGKFVIAFECPGVNHEIIQNGVNGFLVEAGNVTALAEAIRKNATVSHDEKMIIDTTQRYEVANIVQKYENIFVNPIVR